MVLLLFVRALILTVSTVPPVGSTFYILRECPLRRPALRVCCHARVGEIISLRQNGIHASLFPVAPVQPYCVPHCSAFPRGASHREKGGNGDNVSNRASCRAEVGEKGLYRRENRGRSTILRIKLGATRFPGKTSVTHVVLSVPRWRYGAS